MRSTRAVKRIRVVVHIYTSGTILGHEYECEPHTIYDWKAREGGHGSRLNSVAHRCFLHTGKNHNGVRWALAVHASASRA